MPHGKASGESFRLEEEFNKLVTQYFTNQLPFQLVSIRWGLSMTESLGVTRYHPAVDGDWMKGKVVISISTRFKDDEHSKLRSTILHEAIHASMMGQAMLDGKEPLPEYHSGEATWHGPKWQGEAQRIMHHSCELQSSDNTIPLRGFEIKEYAEFRQIYRDKLHCYLCQQCGLEYWRGNGKGKPDEELCKKYQIERGSYFYPEANQEGSAEIAKEIESLLQAARKQARDHSCPASTCSWCRHRGTCKNIEEDGVCKPSTFVQVAAPIGRYKTLECKRTSAAEYMSHLPQPPRGAIQAVHLKYIESMQQWDIVKAGHRKGAVTLTSRIGKFTNAIILDGNLHNGAQLQKDEADIVLRSIEALDDQEEGGGCSLLHLMHGLWTRRIAFMKPSILDEVAPTNAGVHIIEQVPCKANCGPESSCSAQAKPRKRAKTEAQHDDSVVLAKYPWASWMHWEWGEYNITLPVHPEQLKKRSEARKVETGVHLLEGDDRALCNEGQKWLHHDHLSQVVGYLPIIGRATIIMNDYPYVKYLLIGILGIFVLTSKE